ncbi:MAG: hypothetical protein WC705_02790 [Candidatus Paceibacterota bacterium]
MSGTCVRLKGDMQMLLSRNGPVTLVRSGTKGFWSGNDVVGSQPDEGLCSLCPFVVVTPSRAYEVFVPVNLMTPAVISIVAGDDARVILKAAWEIFLGK